MSSNPSSGNDRNLETISSPKNLDLTLKRLDKWVKSIGIVGAVFGLALTAMSIWNIYTQNGLFKTQRLLSQYQAEAAAEKQKLNLEMELITSSGGDDYVNLSFKISNHSARQVHIAMTGIRIWKMEWTDAEDTLRNHPELLIQSVNKVVDCPQNICPKVTAKTRLESTRRQIVLAPGPGGPQRETFGTFRVSAKDLERGIWIQGIAFTVETGKENCAVAGPPIFDGASPIFCADSRKNDPKCKDVAECKFIEDAKFYSKSTK